MSPNRLLHEKSPYLAQHSHNPVDWYPWGDEALEAAKARNKPIFLSIGYSTCHWCHVMAHESFEDPQTAEIMNRNFINIKVDREERPDLDAIYMTAVQMLTQSGGWPMSVFLTPDLRPFYGGTYFPPDDRYGRPSFKTVLLQLSEIWERERDRVLGSAQEIAGLIERAYENAAPDNDALPNAGVTLANASQGLMKIYDPRYGGFGPAPKFPMPVYMECLLAYHRDSGDQNALDAVSHTMNMISEGGITDQLGGGFARYSTDEKWIVPHFEKMLYDNAQLIMVSVSLYQISGAPHYRRLAERAIDYVLRDLTHPDGGFFSAEDADSEGKEGAFYLWTLPQVRHALPAEIVDPFIHRYGVSAHGNFFDPHTREEGQNILVQYKSVGQVAEAFRLTLTETEKRLEQAEQILFELRQKRPRPHRDEKILTEWNGLMISALAIAGAAFENQRYLAAAEKAARFIRDRLYDTDARRLFRRWRDGERKIEGTQADYAFLVQGLLDLFEAAGDPEWLRWAASLEEEQDRLFFDPQNGGYFMNVERPDLLVRIKDDGDNVIPSGNSIATLNGLRLGNLLGKKDFTARARRTLAAFGERMALRPTSLTKMTLALDLESRSPIQVVIIGPKSDESTRKLIQAAGSVFLPEKTVLVVEPGAHQTKLGDLLPFIATMAMKNGRPTAFACFNYACNAPTDDPDALRAQLEQLARPK